MDIEKLKQKILDLAIRGKLVPQDPNDEPASVLIEKIKKEKNELIKQGKIKPSKDDSYIYKGSDNCYYEKKKDDIKNLNSEIPFSLPKNWMWVRIGNYANVITDYVASGSFASLNENVTYYKENNYAILVRTCDFKTNFSKDLVYTDKHGYDFLKNSNLFGGELLLSNIGASIGKVFLVPHLNKKMTLAPNSIMVKTVNEQLNVYLSYIFKSSYGQSILQNISFSSAQAKFNKTDFRKILIPIPPLNEQLRIINQLNLINEKISIINDNSIEISNIINTIKIKILDSYFGEDSSYKSYYGNKISTTLKELIPKDKIGDGDWVLSENMDENGEYSLVQLKHIGNGTYNFNKNYNHINSTFFKKNDCSEIKENYILINRLIASNMNVCLLPKFEFKTITSVDICWIAPDEHYNQEYIMYYLLSPSFQKKVLTKGSGSTRKRISKKNLINIPINIHELEYQQIVVNKIKEMFKILDSFIS